MASFTLPQPPATMEGIDTKSAMKEYFKTLDADDLNTLKTAVENHHTHPDKYIVPALVRCAVVVKQCDDTIENVKDLKAQWSSLFEHCFNKEFRRERKPTNHVIKTIGKKQEDKPARRAFLKEKLIEAIETALKEKDPSSESGTVQVAFNQDVPMS